MKDSKYVRDHISKHGKDIRRATNEKFGITNSLLIRAANGDEKALTQVGDMGKLGKRLSMVMPLIKDDLIAYIEGTTEYNQTLADIYKAGGNGASTIAKAGMDTDLANTQYNHKMEENTAQYQASKKKEKERHDDALDLIELTAWVETHMATVEQKAKLESATSRPFESQLKADADYEEKKIKHLLTHGSEGDLELIPKKHFTDSWAVKAWNSVVDIFS